MVSYGQHAPVATNINVLHAFFTNLGMLYCRYNKTINIYIRMDSTMCGTEIIGIPKHILFKGQV